MPKTWRDYIDPPYPTIDAARKAKARVWGSDLANTIVEIARLQAQHNRPALLALLMSILPNSRPARRQEKIRLLLRHALDLADLFSTTHRT